LLGEQLGVLGFDLDLVRYDQRGGAKRPFREKLDVVDCFAVQPDWL
jgi:hypothetical protein